MSLVGKMPPKMAREEGERARVTCSWRGKSLIEGRVCHVPLEGFPRLLGRARVVAVNRKAEMRAKSFMMIDVDVNKDSGGEC